MRQACQAYNPDTRDRTGVCIMSSQDDMEGDHPPDPKDVHQVPVPGPHALGSQCPRQGGGRTDFHKPLEDRPHRRRLRLVDHQLAIPDLVAQRHGPAHPHAALPGGGKLIPDSFTNYFAFKLCKT